MESVQSGYEVAKGNHPHIESQHEGNESLFCLVNNGECGVTVEVHASPEEQEFLEQGLHEAIGRLDVYFDGKFAELFRGLEIEVGDGLTNGGGEAFGEANKIVLDRQKMLMPVSDEDKLLAELGFANEGDRLRALSAELHSMSAVVYELVHEVGHIVEERADLHLPANDRLKRASNMANLSPTNLYNQDPSRPQEAFAEAFAYKVFGQKVNEELGSVVDKAVEDFIRQKDT